MTKSSAEVEAEVEATRGQIDRTVEALKEKMQPKELFGEATRIMGGTSNKVLETVVAQAKENPIPIALIGAGVAWLALSQGRSKSQSSYGGGYYETYEGYDESGGGMAKIKAKAKNAIGAAKEKVAGAKDKVASAVDGAKTGASDGASQAGGRIQGLKSTVQTRTSDLTRTAQQRYQETLDTEPLILGALGIAVGVAIGAAFKATETENRLIGPHRDKLVDRGREAARTGLDEARTVAQRAYGQVKQELHRQTGPDGEGSTLTEKARALADAGVSTVRDEVDTRLQH